VAVLVRLARPPVAQIVSITADGGMRWVRQRGSGPAVDFIQIGGTMRIGTSLALLLTLLSGTAAAQAQQLGQEGQFTVAAERLFGFHWASVSVENEDGPDGDGTARMVGLGWHYAQGMPYNQPRAGFDYFLTDNFTLGGSLGFFSGSTDDMGGADFDGILLAPRLGYAMQLSRTISFWPRGGLTYITVDDPYVLALSGEAAFVFQPQPNWGILLSPTLDIGPFGETGGDPEQDMTAHSVGVTVGLLGIL